MNRAFLLMAISAIMMTSCQQDSLVDVGLDSSLLTSTSTDDELSASDVFELQSTGDPAQEGRKKHRRDSLCKPIAIEDLQLAITDYIAANYTDSEIVRACQMFSNGNIIVMVKVGENEFVILEFTQDGQFVKELEVRKKGPKGPGRHLTAVDPANLPAAITDYLSANYSGSTIQKAGTNSLGEYEITIEWNGGRKLLLFDASGNFLKELK